MFLLVEDVCNIISKLFNVFCILDLIFIWLVKFCFDVFVFFIIYMVNLFICYVYVLDDWKFVIVKFLLKKFGFELIYKNFCFVSNLLFIFKIVEKVVFF